MDDLPFVTEDGRGLLAFGYPCEQVVASARPYVLPNETPAPNPLQLPLFGHAFAARNANAQPQWGDRGYRKASTTRRRLPRKVRKWWCVLTKYHFSAPPRTSRPIRKEILSDVATQHANVYVMSSRALEWVGGRVENHADLDLADEKFWDDAGPSKRFEASVELAFSLWSLKHPNEPAPRFGRGAFGVRRRRSAIPSDRRPRGVAARET